MFTGIIETLGEVIAVKKEKSNRHYSIRSRISEKLKVDHSVAHNGVCFTITSVNKDIHTVTAVNETLKRTNLGNVKAGDFVNLERSLKVSDLLNGHIVQGHVDQTGICKNIINRNGSWLFTFEHAFARNNITVAKGSVCVNGVSLTVVDSSRNYFSVAIIPHTFEHTNFKWLRLNDAVNIEFDILGKYVAKILSF